MKKMLKFFITIATVVLFASPMFSKEIKIGIGLALPPYNISESNSGMEYEIVKEALKVKGYDLKADYLPFARVLVSFKNKTVDAAMTVNESSGLENVFYSDSHITYQNVAITLEKNNYKIDKISDLSNYSMLAFQNAKKYLGAEYKAVAEKSKNYREIAQQESQVAMLFLDRTQVFIGDINIFKYFRNLTKKTDTSAKVKMHSVFEKTNYKIGFSDKKVRDDFNLGLKEIRKSGLYDKIIAKYIK